jgi:hypothetical protein
VTALISIRNRSERQKATPNYRNWDLTDNLDQQDKHYRMVAPEKWMDHTAAHDADGSHIRDEID